MQTVKPKCTYRVVTTEFWRNSYQIEGADPSDALTMFECLRLTGALPDPERRCLGVILPPETVIDAAGKVVHDDPPPQDDAERYLMMQMWRRMRTVEGGLTPADGVWLAILASARFICEIRQWDFKETMKEVLAK